MASAAPLLGRLQEHLQQLEADPATELDDRLFESCSLALAPTLTQDESVAVVTQLSKVLPSLHGNPTQAIHLLIQLLEPYTFSDILSLNAGVDWVAGLDVRAVPYNRLMLALLGKATTSAVDAGTVATQLEVVAALINLWLCTPDPGIAKDAGDTIVALLKADHEAPPGSGPDPLPAHNQGLMWKRIFGDKDVYGLLFSTCSLKASSVELSKSQKTIAQARLLEWLPLVGSMNWNAVTARNHPEVEDQYTIGNGGGLLYFAAASMVDTKDDVLMHRCLIDFFSDLLKTVKQKEGAVSSTTSVSLDFLISHGIHQKAMSYYLDPSNPRHDPLDLQFLYGPSAHYLAVYASTYPEHFLDDKSVKEKTLKRLHQALDLSPNRWAHTDSPKHDLHILASLPRSALLPAPGTGSPWKTSPLSLLPSKVTNPDVLHTLATVFAGPSREEVVVFSPTSPTTLQPDVHAKAEAQAAHALYYLYLNYNPRLFSDLVTHADTVALVDTALAAVRVMRSVATANWLPLAQSGSDVPESIPTEADFLSMLPNPPTATPPAGALALIAPPSLEHTLPYLIRRAQTFSNIVGGFGDTENAAYKVATAKFDALRALHARLTDHGASEPGLGYEEIVETLGKRIAEGAWSRQEDVGGAVATMEL